jgi:uncharacterized protein YoaH (UPF0181 family)
MGYTLGDFFTKHLGHPGRQQSVERIKKLCLQLSGQSTATREKSIEI